MIKALGRNRQTTAVQGTHERLPGRPLRTSRTCLWILRRGCVCLMTVAIMGRLAVGEASADFPLLGLEPVSVGQIMAPVGMTNAGDGSNRLFVVDQRGSVHVIQDDSVLSTPFLDIESKLVPERAGFDERGLLGLAFHPDFASAGASGEGKFYVYYSAPSPNGPGTDADPVDHMSVVAEYSVTGSGSNVADPDSERILMTFDQPQFNHDGGQLAFGPDGYLYIGSGDGGSSNDNNAGHTGGDEMQPNGVRGNAQDRTNLLGNILRVDVLGSDGPGGEYGIPASNPFVGEGGGVREEILAFGLRNPWRFSFDDGPGGTGQLFIADVGQGDIEEINAIDPAAVVPGQGVNLGWRVREGSFDFDPTTPFDNITPLTDPIAEYAHPGDDIPGLLQIGRSVTGGFVYRGSEFPELVGKYIFADWSTAFGVGNGTLLGLEELAPGQWDLSILGVEDGNPIGLYINAFGEDENGELYVVARSNLAPSGFDPDTGLPGGQILRIVVIPEPASATVCFSLFVGLWLSSKRRC